MTPESLAVLRQRLEDKKAELNERIEKIKADIGRGLDADSKEQAGQLENKEVLDALANEATEEVAQVSAALLRMEEGTYGICDGCGVLIDERRLEARPYALECITCAE